MVGGLCDYSRVMKLRRTTLTTAGCLAALAGLGLARRYNFEPPAWSLLLFAPGFLLLKPKNVTSLLLVVFLGLSLGLWRGSLYMQDVHRLQALTGRQVTIEVKALSDAVYAQGSQLEFIGGNAHLLEPAKEPVKGRFKISGFGEQMVYRGDIVQVTAKLYPMRGSNQARLAYAQIKRVGADSSWINKFTRQFATGMQTALPEPQASFGLGLLIGQRTNLSTELVTQLTMVALVHIVAVSGYNLTILVRAAARLKLGSKYQQLVLALTLIVVFILMTGFSASIVRAAVVSLLSLWAWYYGRKIRPVLLLSFTAALTGLINPFYVWGDLGWYLSFLAFFGVLVIAPQIAGRLFSRPPKNLTTVVVETLSAEIMTLPLIMMTFGQLSLIGLVANALVVLLIPLAMLLSALAAVAGMLVPALAGWLAWPANLLLTYILDVVHLLSSIPAIFLRRSIGVVSMLILYASILLAVAVIRKHQPPKVAINSSIK